MRLKYLGQTFYSPLWGLTNNTIYECLGVEYQFVRVIDDSGEDFVYSAEAPGPANGECPPGKWEIIEDDDKGTLYRACVLQEFDEIIGPDTFEITKG